MTPLSTGQWGVSVEAAGALLAGQRRTFHERLLAGASGMGEVMTLLGDRLYPIITPADLLSRGALVIIIAAIASLYPAWQASRTEPAQALHHV